MAGRYWLGVDVGTTYTAAAIRRDGRTEVVQLATRGAAIPSVLLLRSDGELLTGDTAKRRAVSEPDRVASEFKRRVGDPVPVLVGGSPFAAEALVARLLRWVVDQVTQREGGPPEGIAVTHPANWGPYKLDLLANAIRTAGLGRVTFLSEPAAAARHYATLARVPDGATVAVYDLGGGTFDACVLRKEVDGSFSLLGQPEGIERLGGIDLDQAVFGHVQRSAPDLFEGLDTDDPATRAALAHLREECTAAKEQLSGDVDASIAVLLPGHGGRDVRITRSEFEDLVRPVLGDTIGCVQRSLGNAGVTAADLQAVLLVGGSSRVPLVGQLVAAGLGRPVAVDADPKLVVAQGAALAAESAFADPSAAPTTAVPVVDPGGAGAAGAAGAVGAVAAGAAVPQWSVPTDTPGGAPAGAVAAQGTPAEGAVAAQGIPAEGAVAAQGTPAEGAVAAQGTPAEGVVAGQGTPGAGAAGTGAPGTAVGTGGASAWSPPPDDGRRVVAGGRSKVPFLVGAVVLVAAAVAGFLLLGGDDEDPDDLASGDSTTTTEAEEDPSTTTTAPLLGGAEFADVDPTLPQFVDINSVQALEDGTLSIDFEVRGFELAPRSLEGPNNHIHFFYDNRNRDRAGNSQPDPCLCWLAFGGGSPVEEPTFTLGTLEEQVAAGLRPEICAVVATPEHDVADVTGDDAADIGSGDCIDVTAIAEGQQDGVQETAAGVPAAPIRGDVELAAAPSGPPATHALPAAAAPMAACALPVDRRSA